MELAHEAVDGPACISCASLGLTIAAATTIRLSLGERSGTADLCTAHLQALQGAVNPLLDASPGRRRRLPAATSVPRLRGHEDREVIRAWAAARGLPVARRGGISVAILMRYRDEISEDVSIPKQGNPAGSTSAQRP